MPRLREFASGWRGLCLVAITYVYFLIFAQFAFLKRLSQIGIAQTHLSVVMAAMAFGGISFSLLLAFTSFRGSPRLLLQLALSISGAAAGLTLLPLGLISSVALSLIIGSGLGLLTVTLVSNLRFWIGEGDELLKVGVGTGLGYFLCNVPLLFTATPGVQALTAASLCVVGILVASKINPSPFTDLLQPRNEGAPFYIVLTGFTALVWLDSAAFYIIQNTPSLKAGTWEGTVHLWANGAIHFGAALLSVFILRRRGLSFVLGLSVIAFSIACILLHQSGEAVLASLFYPVGVSLYSVALVAYPSLLSLAESPDERARRAGLIYAVAGWCGSAMGIGMGQHLRRVPLAFVAVAALLILGPALFHFIRRHRRETGLVGATLATAFCIHLGLSRLNAGPPASGTVTSLERGRQVYIAEGCINCHSQYVRPNTSDVLMWGPTQTIEELRLQHPPLIGNRRQGPDLSQVGGRRSPLWLKAHFFNPRDVSHASFMPSYAYLFAGSTRGDYLVQYLSSLKSPEYVRHVALEQSWEPSPSALSGANVDEGARLFSAYCGTCHEAAGGTRLAWASSFKRLPPNLQTGPWLYVHASDPSKERMLHIAQIIKFGIPGTDMPGHEYLPDQDISSIALWLNQPMVWPQQFATIQNLSGEHK